MNINYFFRNNKAGFSIGTVFRTIVNETEKYIQVSSFYLPSPFASILSILRNGTYALKKTHKGEINHITGDVHYLLYFLNSRTTIITVHDIMYYSYLSGIKKKIWKFLYINSLKRAAKIIFISEFVKQQTLNHISLNESKMTVIPNPIDPIFKETPKEFNQHKPRILHIGTLRRKNLNRSICALEGINCHLHIIGNIDKTTKKLLLEKGIEYSCNSNLTHEQIVNEYCKADIVNFPSLFEGFGMPIIEGQATGRIVVTSSIPPMIDIAGDGAAIVDPYSVDSIHHTYSKIITDKKYRNNIITKGLKNAERFKVETIAKLYLDIYNQIEIEK